jgi:AraC-like DNA-binding protein
MTALINFFLGISFFALIFVISFLVKKKPLAYYFFIGSYIIFLFSLLNNLFAANGLMQEWPHLFRVISPFQFLLAPLSYFFCRITLRPYQKLNNSDLVHLIPFGLSFMGLIPIYILPAEEKLILINVGTEYTGLINRVDAFGLSFFTTLKVKFGIFMVYMFFQWKMLLRFRSEALPELKKRNRLLFIWLRFDSFLKTFFGLFIFVTAWWGDSVSIVAIIQVCLVAFELMTSTAFLISSPSLLKGMIFKSDVFTGAYISEKNVELEDRDFNILGFPEGRNQIQVLSSSTEPQDNEAEIIRNIEAYFQTEQPYLREDFTLNELGRAISVPSRQISQIIKNRLGLSYPDYINQVRFNYLENLMKSQPKVLDFSIDALAKMAGFNSRSGFYKAFKKNEKYQTPSQMMEYYKTKGRQ